MAAPLVSIIIPAYNAAHFLPQAIESCLAQTYATLEIIVVNDGSTDNTAELVTTNYPQVRLINQANQGLAGARNTGIAQATGAYIQFLDADDALLPKKIERCLERFRTEPDAGLVYTDYEIRNGDMSALSSVPKPDVSMAEGYLLPLLIETTSTLFRVPCPLIRAELVREVGGFERGMQGVEDWHFWIKLAAIGTKFAFVDEVLVWYRHTEGSMSRDMLLMTRSRLHAMQALRTLDLQPEINLDRLIAGRHHALAMVLWGANQRAEARQQFRAALKLDKAGRLGRWLLILLSYFLPMSAADRLLAQLLRLKG